MKVEDIYVKFIKNYLKDKLNAKVYVSYSFKKESITITVLALGNIEFTRTYEGFYDAIQRGVPSLYIARLFVTEYRKHINHVYFK